MVDFNRADFGGAGRAWPYATDAGAASRGPRRSCSTGYEIDTELQKAVVERLGSAAISSDAETCSAYGRHTLPGTDHIPDAVLYPHTTEAVQTIVELANTHSVPLFPIGMGRNLGLGSRAPMRTGQVVIDLGRRMNRIVEINTDLGFCVVEPGVTFEALYAKLEQQGGQLMMSPKAGPPDGSVLGNAIDKGGGSGPAGNHFDNVCGMEVVLGNGGVIRTGDGGVDAAEHPNWHVTRYSFGPALDGLFTQSNYGIVTRAGIWLQRKPSKIRLFFFVFPDDNDLGEIVDLIRPLKASGAVPTMIRATNDLYLLSSQERHPRSGERPCTPLDPGKRKQLRAKHNSGAWTVASYRSDLRRAMGVGPLTAANRRSQLQSFPFLNLGLRPCTAHGRSASERREASSTDRPFRDRVNS